MFDYNDYYKMYNGPIEAKYAEMRTQLSKFLEDLAVSKEKDKGFRSRMMQYSKTQGLYVKALTDLEQKWQPGYYKYASLSQMKEDQRAIYGDLMEGSYENSMLDPENCTKLSSKELGPILSMFAALFHNAAADAFMHRRFRLLKIILLYFDMHRLLQQKQVRADQLMSLYRNFVLDNMQLSAELDFHHRIDPSDAFLDEMIASEDLSDPYYLYLTGLPVSKKALLWHDFFNNEGADQIDLLARQLCEGFMNGLPENSRRSERWLVPICCSPGMEKVAVACGKLLEKNGFVYFLRPEERGGVSSEYLADHRYDLAKVMGEEDLKAYLATVNKTISASESLVKGVAGRIEIVEYRQDYSQELLQEAFASEKPNELHRKGRRFISETTRRFYREIRAGKETFLYEAGGMQAGSICSLMLPKIAAEGKEREDFVESFGMILDTLQNNEQNNRALKTISNTLDNGDAIYLQGRGDNETDLVVSLKILKKPAEESNFQSSIGNTTLPGGYVYTRPQPEETNGLLHFDMTVVNGVRYQNLKLTIEEGYVVDYSCDGFEDHEQERQYLQKNLFGGRDRLPFAETALGVNTALYCRYAENYSEQLPRISVLLPEEIRASICPSFVFGSGAFETGEARVINRATGKTVVCLEPETTNSTDDKTSEAFDWQKTSDSLRTRIPMQFEDIGRISVIRNGNMVGDVIREGLFVPVGTDSLNKPLMKRMYKITE